MEEAIREGIRSVREERTYSAAEVRARIAAWDSAGPRLSWDLKVRAGATRLRRWERPRRNQLSFLRIND